MSTTTAKRPLEHRSASPDSGHSDGETSSTSDEARRRSGKPGRKPIDVEAKNKRTAQNRAAQRAFRERKERKMKELEDKVHSLEQLNEQSVVEAEFLRSQLMTLVSELRTYRPENRKDSQVLEYLAKHESAGGKRNSKNDDLQVELQEPDEKQIEANVQKKMDFTFAFPWKDHDPKDKDNNVVGQFPSPGSSLVSSSASATSSSSNKRKNITTPNTLGSISDNDTSNHNMNVSNTPSSSSTGWIDNMFYSDDAQQLPQFSSKPSNSAKEDTRVPVGYDSIIFSNQFNFDDQFDEQVSQFCARMNEACGTKECPFPRQIPTFTPANVDDNNNVAKISDQVSPADFSNTWDTNIAASPTFGKIGFGQDQRNSAPSLSATIETTPPSNEISNQTDFNEYVVESRDIGSDNTYNKNNAQTPIPFIDTSLAFPNEDDQSLIFRDSQQDSSNLFAEFLDENEGEIEDNLIKENIINEEPTDVDPQRQPQNEVPIEPVTDTAIEGVCSVATKTISSSDNDVVPSRDGNLLKCSEVWDRITAHPKYTAIDIDGLCQELMAKAKCSEKGVVVQADDVQRVLNRHMDDN